MPVRPGQSELTVARGDRVPFLGYREGELVMRLTDDMEHADDPKRRKVAEVARKLGALITHDGQVTQARTRDALQKVNA